MVGKNDEVLAVVEQENMVSGEAELSQEVSVVENQAQGITIRNEDDFQKAAEFGRLLKRKTAEVTEFFKPMKKAAHDAHKQVCDREKAMLAPIAKAEKILKRTMGEYQLEQQMKYQEREKQLRALARAEEERLLAEAIKAEEAGEIEMSDEHFENAEFMARAASEIHVPTATVKASGVSTTEDYEITRIDYSKVPIEFMSHIIRPVDEKAIIRIIRANKGAVKIPGVEFRKIAKISIRK